MRLRLSLSQFAKLVGAKTNELPTETIEILKKENFRYRLILGKELARLIKSIDEEIDSGQFSAVGRGAKSKWLKGWQENLEAYVEKGFEHEALMPKYFRPDQPVRIFGHYATSQDPNFEWNFRQAFTYWLFNKYLKEPDNIYEFGCGSGANLIILSKLFPWKKLYGLDWVWPSVDIVKIMRNKLKINVDGVLFDMFNPDKSFKLKSKGAVLLFSVLEQMGDQFKPFINYLINAKPELVVHVDSIEELYDPKKMLDDLALKFMKKRKYLSNYLNYLYRLEATKKVKIFKIQRVNFGSLYLDAYSFDIWKPL